MLGIVLSSAVTAEADQAPEYEFDIPRQGVETALSALATQTGALLLFPYDLVQPVDSKPVSGRYTVEDALAILLQGTGLAGGLTEGGVITISRAGTTNSQGGMTMAQNHKKSNGTRALVKRSGLLGMLAAVFSTGAWAQEAADVDEEETEIDEIVVTGTNIRGVAPVGSPLIQFDREDIARTGRTSLQEFFETVPQNFGGGVSDDSLNFGNGGTFDRAGGAALNLRGLGNSSTLVLFNGNRLAAANGDFVDVSMIPISAVERIDVLPDGASAIYGSDAIAGVVNVVLRDDFEGAETSLVYGTVTDGGRDEVRASQAFGRSSGTGHALIAYDYMNQSELTTAEREFTETEPGPTALFPNQERHSLFASASQDIADNLSVFGMTTYSRRANDFIQTAFAGGIPSIFEGTSQQFNAAAGLDVEFDDSWAGSFTTSYSRLDRNTITENPNASLVTDANQEVGLLVINASFDGVLFEAPGGKVRAAFGGQFRRDTFEQYTVTAFAGTPLAPFERSLSREVYAAFGEINVPLIGAHNNHEFGKRLEFSIAARYEDYSDSGSPTDPKIGVLYEPFNGLVLRGSYGTSFRAPRLTQVIETGLSVSTVNFPTWPDPLSPTGFSPSLILNGSNPDLEPETSTSWTVGADFEPSANPNVKASITYFDIDFTDRITTPTSGLELLQIFADPRFATVVTRNPDIATVNNYFAVPNFFNNAGLAPEDVVLIGDNRVQNLSSTNVNGLDFSLNYQLDTAVGAFNLQSSGSYYFEFVNQLTESAEPNDAVDTVFNTVDLRVRNSVAWSNEGWGAVLALDYTDGYTNIEASPEEPIDSWTTVDLQISYRIEENEPRSLFRNTQFSLNIQNLFDDDPPFVDAGDPDIQYDAANANPLGRFVSFRITKTW